MSNELMSFFGDGGAFDDEEERTSLPPEVCDV